MSDPGLYNDERPDDGVLTIEHIGGFLFGALTVGVVVWRYARAHGWL